MIKIAVDNINKEKITKTINDFKNNISYSSNFFTPNNNSTIDLDSELTKQEKNDRKKSINDKKFTDWNKISLDKLSKYLENKYMFDSSVDAHAIFRLIDFYKKNKK